MTFRRRLPGAAVLVLAFAVLVAACGSDDDADATTVASVTVVTTVAATTASTSSVASVPERPATPEDYRVKAQDAIQKALGEDGNDAEVTCATPAAADIGTSFRCTATGSTGVLAFIAEIDSRDHISVFLDS
jgi:hypothetical protein